MEVCIYNIYLNWWAMRNRSKIDWSKPFTFVDDKQRFDELDNEDSLVISITADESKPKPVLPYKK